MRTRCSPAALATLAALAALAFTLTAAATGVQNPRMSTAPTAPAAGATAAALPLVIAHRGASGHRPEHTLEAYRLAIELGADVIEPDLVSTKDGQLVARHEPDISATTDVAQRPEFAARRRTAVIDGTAVTGWFTTDFTLAELRTLRAVQPREYRSQDFDGRWPVPTLDEIIALAKRESAARGRTIAIYPETKHPTWHREQGLPLEEPLLAALAREGWTTRDAPVWVQSFESGNLRWLRPRTGVKLVQLVGEQGPLDFADVAGYADAIGASKALLADGDFVARAHAAGLAVHAWTFRDEPRHIDARFGGDPLREYAYFFALGVDGVFSDFPDTALAARAAFARAGATAPGTAP
jgi:glycerophosphoryl diester phosphodiesterase